MEDWQVIRERRIGHADAVKQISRDTGFAINTIRKYSRSSVPPQRTGAPTRTPLMAAYQSDVDALLKPLLNPEWVTLVWATKPDDLTAGLG